MSLKHFKIHSKLGKIISIFYPNIYQGEGAYSSVYKVKRISDD